MSQADKLSREGVSEDASEEVKLRMDLLKSLTLVFREMDSQEAPEQPRVTAAVRILYVYVCLWACTCVFCVFSDRWTAKKHLSNLE